MVGRARSAKHLRRVITGTCAHLTCSVGDGHLHTQCCVGAGRRHPVSELLCSTTLYYALLRSLLRSTILYYTLLRSTTLYYALLSTTLYYALLRSTTLYYALLRSTTLSYALLRSTTLHSWPWTRGSNAPPCRQGRGACFQLAACTRSGHIDCNAYLKAKASLWHSTEPSVSRTISQHAYCEHTLPEVYQRQSPKWELT